MNGPGTGELVVLTANEVVLTKMPLVMPAQIARRLRGERPGALIGQNDLLWRCDWTSRHAVTRVDMQGAQTVGMVSRSDH